MTKGNYGRVSNAHFPIRPAPMAMLLLSRCSQYANVPLGRAAASFFPSSTQPTRALSSSPPFPGQWSGGKGREFPDRRPPRKGEYGGRGGRQSFGRRPTNSGPARTETRDGEPIPQLQGEGVYGIHSVLQALESRHRQVHALFLRDPKTMQDSGKKKSATDVQALERIQALAAENGVPVSYTR